MIPFTLIDIEQDRQAEQFILEKNNGKKRDRLENREPFAFETGWAGVFAAGDIRHGSTQQVSSAVGEGAAAAISIREYLKTV